jgi:phage gpG-like protein
MVEFIQVTSIDLGLKDVRTMRNRVKDTRPAMRAVARYLVERSQENFDEAADPVTNVAWKQLAPSTVARKGHDTILIDSGDMQRLIFPRWGRASAEAASDMPYSSRHNKGEGVTMRRFLGLNDDIVRGAQEIVDDYLKNGSV